MTRFVKALQNLTLGSGLKKAGWKVFRFWASKVMADPNRCAEKIMKYMVAEGYR